MGAPKITVSRWLKRIYCSPECIKRSKIDDLQFHFKARTMPEPNSGCFIWLGATNNRGYGILTTNGENILAHRLAYEFEHGKFDQEKQVLHHCDNPPCVNPDHLFLGTASDNMQDCARKGRIGGQKKLRI